MYDNLCTYIHDELEDMERKAKSGEKLSPPELEYGDMLAHFKKTLLIVEGMEEAGDDYSGDGYPYDNMQRRDYSRNADRTSRARGRTNASRDSMGRYSGRGYSMADGMEELLGEMRDMIHDLPEERRRKAERLLNEMERV